MRKTDSHQRRQDAAEIARGRAHPLHLANGEETRYRSARSLMSFTKGLPHRQEDGLVADDNDPRRLRAAIDGGFTLPFDLNVPLGDRDPAGALRWRFHGETGPGRAGLDEKPAADQHRRWEAPTAGCVFELEGPDAQAVTMPPAPTLVVETDHGIEANPELVAELAEVYWLSLLRDVPFAAFDGFSATGTSEADKVEKAVHYLGTLPFYTGTGPDHPRRRLLAGESLSRQTVFRGHTPGDRKGPYLSQFMLMGNRQRGGLGSTEQGYLNYGSARIDMRVRVATAERDYMTHWNEWLDVQNGANVLAVQDETGYETDPSFRFIATPRDLATYVHFDALYEAYLNACLWLLNEDAPADPYFADTLRKTRHTEGFALWGGPHILTLVTEVATRALKAVRFQKFNTHLRLRPEALAGLVAAYGSGAFADADQASDDATHAVAARMAPFYDALNQPFASTNLLEAVAAHNAGQNGRHQAYLADKSGIARATDLPLLPMAFPEGSPMHPSYGAGHAAVAGACVTILKAFFDEDACLVREIASADVKAVAAEVAAGAGFGRVAFVPADDGSTLEDKGASLTDFLRIGDELNKLAANISIGRDIAGVHYYSDYIDSLHLGEAIAIGILQEQSLCYPKDPFRVSLTTFDGDKIVIGEGEVQRIQGGSAGDIRPAADAPAVLPHAAE